MRVFLAGIMQGSRSDHRLQAQDYRPRLKSLIERHLPQAEVYDPLADHGQSVQYDDEEGRRVFLHHIQMCREDVDVVVAYLPQASMGTAIEIWEAVQQGRAVIAISPLTHNWVLRFCTHATYEDEASFVGALESGEVQQVIDRVRSAAPDSPRAAEGG